MTYFAKTQVTIADGANLDAFSRLRVSQNINAFSGVQSFNKMPLFYTEQINGNAQSIYQQNRCSTLLAVTGSGDSVRRQTKEHFLYHAGQGIFALLTFGQMHGVENVIKEVGFNDQYDGILLQASGTDINIVLRTFTDGTVRETVVSQSSWNINTCQHLDFSKTQIFLLDAQYLGVGRVRCGFDLSGSIVYAHEFNNANSGSAVYMSRGTLPLSYYISSSGGQTTLEAICASYNREGSPDELGVLSSVKTPSIITPAVATTTKSAILAARLRDLGGKFRQSARIIDYGITNIGSQHCVAELILNGQFTTPFTWVDDGETLQYATGSGGVVQYVVGTGHRFSTLVALATNQQKASAADFVNSIPNLGFDVTGSSDVVAVVVEAAAGSQSVFADISLKELF